MKKRLIILFLCAVLAMLPSCTSDGPDTDTDPDETESAHGETNESDKTDETEAEETETEITESEETEAEETETEEIETEETESEETDAEITETVPDFTVYTADGTPVKLSDMRGRPVVLNFWASWCGPCKNEMPDFNDAYLKYGDEVVFMMVNLTDGSTETVKTASDFIASKGYKFPVYYDTSGEAAGKYGISSIPTTFVIDENGVGVGYATGMIDAETLEYAISLIYEK